MVVFVLACRGQVRRLATAAQYAGALLAFLERAPGAEQAVAAGSMRRRRDTVGDLDLLVTPPDGALGLPWIAPELRQWLARRR